MTICVGFTSHNSAARRTSQFEYFGPASETFRPESYYGLAAERPDAIQGGAPFPDYLYACGDEHDAGEEAHWTPFQIAAAGKYNDLIYWLSFTCLVSTFHLYVLLDYIRATYPNWESETRDQNGPGLVAFMLGVVSHYIADMNWHGLETIPSGEGLIRTMGFADFNCTDGDLCQIAHSAADTGGEFAAGQTLDLSWYPNRKWFVPTTDLVNIYAIMNASGQGPLVESQWINECAVIFYAGSYGTSIFGDLVYPLLAPYVGGTLLSSYLDFHCGGIDDNAAWTGFMWNRFADWVSSGPPDTPPNLSEELSDSQSAGPNKKLMQQKRKAVGAIKNVLRKHKVLPILDTEPVNSIFFMRHHDSGVTVGRKPEINSEDAALVIELVDAIIDVYILPTLLNLSVSDLPAIATLNSIEIMRKEAHSRITNGYKPLPSDPRALPARFKQTVYSRSKNASLSQDDAFCVRGEDRDFKSSMDILVQELALGESPHAYFGSSATVADYSGSGKACDVLVGSPGAGRTGGPQEGSARILFGAACDTNEATGFINFRGGVIGGNPDGEPSYERFGWSSGACDINGDGIVDAVICAPSFGGRNVSAVVGNYSGRCDIFFGPFNADSSAEFVPRPDAQIYGDRNWGEFGFAVVVGDIDGDGLSDLAISAPSAGRYRLLY